MQYKRQAVSIARGKSTKANALTMVSRTAYCLVAMLPVLVVAGCADTMPDGTRLKRFTEVIRGYDNTLTKSEREAAISDLQKEKERQDQQVGQTDGAPKAN
jgi:hypothetical protein